MNNKLHCKEDRKNRLNILIDLIYSYKKHLGGEKWHSRLCDVVLFNDMLVIGKTKEPTKELHREHVVPCVYLFEKCFELIKNDINEESRELVYNILDKYLKVVIISKEKAHLLDGPLKLKTKMPLKWFFENGDEYSRLKEVYGENLEEIEWYI